MILIKGHFTDQHNKITLRPSEAKELAADLMRAAIESEDHGIYEVRIVRIDELEADDIGIIIFKVNPHLE